MKNSISHRYKALCALRDYLTGQTEEGEGGEERGGGEEGENQAKRPKQDRLCSLHNHSVCMLCFLLDYQSVH